MIKILSRNGNGGIRARTMHTAWEKEERVAKEERTQQIEMEA
jgi:hypothetical protein